MAEAIRYFYSLSSPWAYLGGPRLAAIAARHGVGIEHRPITVLEENGGIRLRTRPDARQRYHALELARFRDFLGMPLNLQPRFYPTDPKPAALMVIAARRRGADVTALSHGFLRALWAEEADYADPATLARIADAVPATLARAAIESVTVLGAFQASPAVRRALSDRIV